MEKEVTPQLYHSDEDHDDEIESQYSNELSQLRNIDRNHNPSPEVNQSELLTRQRHLVDIIMKSFYQ